MRVFFRVICRVTFLNSAGHSIFRFSFIFSHSFKAIATQPWSLKGFSLYPVGYLLIWQPCNQLGTLARYLPTLLLFWTIGGAQDYCLGSQPFFIFKDSLKRIHQGIDIYIKGTTWAPVYITLICLYYRYLEPKQPSI